MISANGPTAELPTYPLNFVMGVGVDPVVPLGSGTQRQVQCPPS